MNQPTDEELIARCASGDRACMDMLVSRYHGKLLDLALRHLGNRETSADVAQMALVKVFQNAAMYRRQASFRTWIYAITLNLIRDEYRRRKRKGESLISEITDDDSSEPDWTPEDKSAEDEALQRIESLAVWQAVDRLSEERRTAVILKFKSGLTYDEVAEVMQTSSGTVKSWIHYALKSLRKSLDSGSI